MSMDFGFSLPAYTGYAASFGAGATLALDFTSGNQTLDPRITFTRSTTATRTNSSGLIQSAAINAPRFDYNPTTLAPLGLLIEEQRTNLLLNSLIDGTNLSTQIVVTTAVSTTLSFYGTGQIVLSGSASATVVGTGAYPSRRTLTFTPTVGALTLTVTGTVQYAQLEAGAFATSYIPTVASQVTRAADVAVMTGANFSSWYNATEGTLYAEANANNGASLQPCFASIDDSTVSNRIQLRRESSDTLAALRMVSSGGSIAATQSGGSVITANKQAASFIAGGQSAAINGTLFTGITSITPMPTVNRLDIGAGVGSTLLNGTISRIAYYPRRLGNAELQGITS